MNIDLNALPMLPAAAAQDLNLEIILFRTNNLESAFANVDDNFDNDPTDDQQTTFNNAFALYASPGAGAKVGDVYFVHANPDIISDLETCADTAANAEEYFATNPGIDMAKVQADTHLARLIGMPAFLQLRKEEVAHRSIQPASPLPAAVIERAQTTMPPLDATTLPAFHAMPDGVPILIPEGFVNNRCPYEKPKEPGYQKAVARLHVKDFNNGRSSIFPLDAARELFTDLPFHSIPNFIVAKNGGPEGRLVANVTAAGLNAKDKKERLSATYGPIKMPRTAHFCKLFASVRTRFPDKRLVMFKADYEGWFKRVLLKPEQSGLLAMVIHIEGKAHVVIPHVGQFGCQEFNYAASQASAFIYATTHAHDIEEYGIPLSHVFSDDTVGFVPEDDYLSLDAWMTANAAKHAGTDAQPQTKKEHSYKITALGVDYDITDMDNATVALSQSTFLKLVRVLFREFPRTLNKGSSQVSVRMLQRLGSYVCIRST